MLRAGIRPYELRGRSAAEIERIICESEVSPPSYAFAPAVEAAEATIGRAAVRGGTEVQEPGPASDQAGGDEDHRDRASGDRQQAGGQETRRPREWRVPQQAVPRAGHHLADHTRTTTDLDDGVVRCGLQRGDDAALLVGIDEEILAERLPGAVSGHPRTSSAVRSSAGVVIGAQPLMDAVLAYLPSPADRPPL